MSMPVPCLSLYSATSARMTCRLLLRHHTRRFRITPHSQCSSYSSLDQAHDRPPFAFTKTHSEHPLSPSVPASNRALLGSLDRLAACSSAHLLLDPTRFRLARQTLEREHPTLRVGVLGHGDDGERAGRRLVRALLADALDESGAWEEQMTNSSGPLLLRYGAVQDSTDQAASFSLSASPVPGTGPAAVHGVHGTSRNTGNAGLETRAVPSRFLQSRNVEILLMRIENVPTTDLRIEATTAAPESELLTPIVQTSASGRGSSLVRYPLHRAIVLGSGLDGALALGRMSNATQSPLVFRAIDVASGNWSSKAALAVNVDKATSALAMFRSDPSTGPKFNECWQTSGVERLAEWLIPQHGAQKVVGMAYIESFLDDTERSIEHAENTADEAVQAATIPEARRDEYQSAIGEWAQSAHAELQDLLPRMEILSSWRRTSWTRLLWAVDDSGWAAEDVLKSLWLVNAEASLAYLAGTIRAAGFPVVSIGSVNLTDSSSEQQQEQLEPPDYMTGADKQLGRDLMAQGEVSVDSAVFRTRPWPQSIYFSRRQILSSLVPTLQARAQTLVLQTLTTIGGTSALGAWLYIATSGAAGIYGAGAVASLGLVWSLRRLQRGWTVARHKFRDEILDAGRVVLRQVEGEMRTVVREGVRPAVEEGEVQGWREAREAIAECRAELQTLRAHQAEAKNR